MTKKMVRISNLPWGVPVTVASHGHPLGVGNIEAHQLFLMFWPVNIDIDISYVAFLCLNPDPKRVVPSPLDPRMTCAYPAVVDCLEITTEEA